LQRNYTIIGATKTKQELLKNGVWTWEKGSCPATPLSVSELIE